MTGAVEPQLARRLVEEIGGRYARELGIDVDRDDEEIERWALAATLFGNRIPGAIAERTFRVLTEAGVATLFAAGRRTWDELVELLDRGGYVRYDFRTATRLQALARVIEDEYGGRLASLGKAVRDPAELEKRLDTLPGWGPVTVRLFLRELRGLWPGAEPPLDKRALGAAEHLGLLEPRPGGDPLAYLRRLAAGAGLDVRDLEAALVRLALAHGRGRKTCPGGPACRILERARKRTPPTAG
jgi:hypothetical protein